MAASAFKTDRLRLGLATWANETTIPTFAAAKGSLDVRNGLPGSRPTELYYKTGTPNTAWARQNLININIFNVLTFGAKGDGVTNDTAAIQAAINACNAAGGGTVYFPATPNFYTLQKIVAQADIITMSNMANVRLLGDGYASKIRQIGSANGSETHMFGIHNGTNGIIFDNLYIDCTLITSPDPAQQNHGINIYGRTGDVHGGPFNIEIRGCYFGKFVGDAVRQIGETGQTVDDVRHYQCVFNCEDGTGGSRTCVSSQRYSRFSQVHFCWIRGSHDQQIDWEPTAGEGPHQWSILGNHIDNELHVVVGVTLSGAGAATFDNPSRRNIYAYNTFENGGGIAGVAVGHLDYHANFQELFVGGTAVLIFEQFGQYERFSSNIVVNNELDVPQSAILVFSGTTDLTSDLMIQDNIVDTTSTMLGGTVAIGVQDVSGCMMTGNHCTINCNQINSTGIQQSNNNHGSDRTLISGNMVFNDGTATMLAAARVTSTGAGINARNNSFQFNYYDAGVGSTNGVRWEFAGGAAITGFQVVAGNYAVNLGTSQFFDSVGAATLEGASGPGTGILTLRSPTFPEGNVTAVVGTLLTDNSSSVTPGSILTYKESGSGNTGWVGIGGFEITMGCASMTTATSNQFFAPGGMDLATESSVEIQWAVPRPGILRNLRVRCTAGTGGGVNTLRVRKNGVNSAPTASIGNTQTSAVGSATTTVAAGDLISFVSSKAVAPVTPQTNVVCTFELV